MQFHLLVVIKCSVGGLDVVVLLVFRLIAKKSICTNTTIKHITKEFSLIKMVGWIGFHDFLCIPHCQICINPSLPSSLKSMYAMRSSISSYRLINSSYNLHHQEEFFSAPYPWLASPSRLFPCIVPEWSRRSAHPLPARPQIRCLVCLGQGLALGQSQLLISRLAIVLNRFFLWNSQALLLSP